MLIGISGLAGSGKDTVADFLVNDHGFTKVALADPLKRIARDVYDFTEEQLWGPSENRNAPDPRYPREDGTCLSPREALQLLGTEWGRRCYADTWIKCGIRNAQTLLTHPSARYSRCDGIRGGMLTPAEPRAGVAIPDIRFRNEMDAIRAAGGFLVRVVRPGAGLGGAAGVHVSEREQLEISDDAFDCVLHNAHSLESLREAVGNCVARLRG